VVHRNAALNVHGRLLLCRRIEAGWPVARAAEAQGISRQCAYKWWRRYHLDGPDALGDRSSRPRRTPTRTPRRVEERIGRIRAADKLGPARISSRTGVPASTVHRVLVRQGLSRLDRMDRPSGTVVRRYERSRPGELVHVDIKKLGKIPAGGGHRRLGRAAARKHKRGRIGYHYIHSAVDDYSRLAYSEILPDETGATAAAFWTRAETWFRARGVVVERVLTDNGFCYRGRLFNAALDQQRIAHRYTRPYRPQTNGKVERFNRTLLENGPTCVPTPATPPATAPSPAGSTATTTTAGILPSAVCHLSAVSPTSPPITARPFWTRAIGYLRFAAL
jgi:transposase InsO family protein